MKRILPLLAVTLVATAATAGSASAVTTQQEIEVWKHRCAAIGGDVSIGAGRSFGIVGCGKNGETWGDGTITQFRTLCLTAFKGSFFQSGTSDFGSSVVCFLL